jgi:hypothetical protein
VWVFNGLVVVDDEGDIELHQSFVGTWQMCNERGRLSLVEPSFNEPTNDSALIGTGAHRGIQAVLTKEIEPAAIGSFTYETTLKLAEEGNIRYVNYSIPGQLAEYARCCAEAWAKEILPSIEPGGQVEVEFKVPLFKRNGRQVSIAGIMDYVTPSGVIIDWKTASRKFYQKEKQRTAIQPTVYSVAAVRGGLGRPFEYPVRFLFGVMVRGQTPVRATTQIVEVQRTAAHEGWLLDQIESLLDLAEALGVNRRWPRDEDHHLCNETWCPWWSICKGARLSSAQDKWSA